MWKSHEISSVMALRSQKNKNRPDFLRQNSNLYGKNALRIALSELFGGKTKRIHTFCKKFSESCGLYRKKPERKVVTKSKKSLADAKFEPLLQIQYKYMWYMYYLEHVLDRV